MQRRLFPNLRPHICHDCRARLGATQPYQKRFAATSELRPLQDAGKVRKLVSLNDKEKAVLAKSEFASDNAEAVERRLAFLGGADALQELFPRWQKPNTRILSAAEFMQSYGASVQNEVTKEITVYGRMTARRKLGSDLIFLDIATSESTSNRRVQVQVSVNKEKLEGLGELRPEGLKEFDRKLRRGDWIAVTGTLGRDRQHNVRIDATRFPTIIAPSLQQIPEELTDTEVRMRNRHADQIVNPSSRDIIYFRARLIRGLRHFLEENGFVEVNTPLLVAGAGGAVARPFETVATEFGNTKLSLRVAPELFLKRLIVGGMDKIYELGPAFRNEGVDLTHNPEFTICEFYCVLTNLNDLMRITQALFKHLSDVSKLVRQTLHDIPALDIDFETRFIRLEFIPALQSAIRNSIPAWIFPDLSHEENAQKVLTEAAVAANITLPVPLTLPRILDALASHYLEPLCEKPTFITFHPECMSPLAKSFTREPLQPGGPRHRVSARAELFVRGREYVNCYEEENSPMEQRRKFMEQLALRAAGDDEAPGVVDESYVRALEWGMPPTGGWGCGVDRIIMLFGGKARIADVLPFGSLRNVVGLASTGVRQSVAQSQIVDGRTTQAEEQGQEHEQGRMSQQSEMEQRDEELKRQFEIWLKKRRKQRLPFTARQLKQLLAEQSAIDSTAPTPPSESQPPDDAPQVSTRTSRKQSQDHAPVPEVEKPEPKPVIPKLLSFKDLMNGTGKP